MVKKADTELIGIFYGRAIKAAKAASDRITRSQTGSQAFNAIVKKYGSIEDGEKYFHAGNGVWKKYSLDSDKKRTGKLASSEAEWKRQPHKLDLKGIDTKDLSSRKPAKAQEKPTKKITPKPTGKPISKPVEKPKMAEKGVKEFANFRVEWVNRDKLTEAQIKIIDKDIFAGMLYYTNIVKNPEYRKILKAEDEEAILRAKYDKPIGVNLIYVNNKTDSGRGVADSSGFKVFAAPLNVHGASEIEEVQNPISAAIHELHHVFGSHTEFDEGSKNAYYGFIFDQRINDPRFKPVKQKMLLETMTLLSNAKSRQTWVANVRRRHKFLYTLYSDKYTKALKDEGADQKFIDQVLTVIGVKK